MSRAELIKNEVLERLCETEECIIADEHLAFIGKTLDEVLDEDGDYGVVECGKCGLEIFRKDAFLSDKHLYLCNDCEE